MPIAAAATFVVLATVAAAAPPVRHWLARQLSPASEPVSVPAPDAPRSAAPRAEGIVASFAPTDTALLMRIDRRQVSGALELVAASGDRITAQAMGEASTAEMMVLPGQLRIANAATSVADYRVAIPPSVRVVRVIVGGEEVALIRNDALLRRRIDLR
jgi:hypothetical protein